MLSVAVTVPGGIASNPSMVGSPARQVAALLRADGTFSSEKF